VHLEATDEAGHQGDPAAKVQAIELIDNLVLAPILKGLQDQPFRILIMPDHPTPCDVRTHTYEPVPYLYYDSSRDQAGPAAFDELSAQGRGEALEAWTLMDTLAAPEPVPQA